MTARVLQGDALLGSWYSVPDGDPVVQGLFKRHYSHRRYRDGRSQRRFIGPGAYLLLMTRDGRAIFAWRKFLDGSGQQGICCSIFRNEGPWLSSNLIREADDLAWKRWPASRHYTYVNPRKIRSTNPGYCFLAAGWRRGGTTKGGLIILERLP